MVEKMLKEKVFKCNSSCCLWRVYLYLLVLHSGTGPVCWFGRQWRWPRPTLVQHSRVSKLLCQSHIHIAALIIIIVH